MTPGSVSKPRYGFRILGPCMGERRLIDWWAAFRGYVGCDERARSGSEAYLSAFTFGEDFREHLDRTGSTKGFDGVCGADWLWFDLDRDEGTGGVDAARRDAATLCVQISERFAIDADSLLAFYSGSKGFHIGLPLSGFSPMPGPVFHATARRVAEQVAQAAGVVIDAGVYDKVRAFRAPNSRHPKTGRYKRRLTVDELMHLDEARIVALAEKPTPFEAPDNGLCGIELPAAWNKAAEQVREQIQAIKKRRAAVLTGSFTNKLNRLTFDIIRNVDPIQTGDRHRLIYSAARNLGEFGCPIELAHALLTESGLDCGLSPSEVRRQIECGITDAGKASAV